jgi:hypothetical protein
MATQLPVDMQRRMQDCAMQRTANVVLDFLHATFGPLVVSTFIQIAAIAGISCHLSAKT